MGFHAIGDAEVAEITFLASQSLNTPLKPFPDFRLKTIRPRLPLNLMRSNRTSPSTTLVPLPPPTSTSAGENPLGGDIALLLNSESTTLTDKGCEPPFILLEVKWNPALLLSENLQLMKLILTNLSFGWSVSRTAPASGLVPLDPENSEFRTHTSCALVMVMPSLRLLRDVMFSKVIFWE